MSGPQLLSVSFQQVFIFLAAARHENFTRAAAEMNMTQASVSRNIDALERSLGLILFIREKQRVRLTPAGRELYKDWTRMMTLADKSVEKALTAQTGAIHQLSIGDYNTTEVEAYLLPILTAFEAKHPNVTVNVDCTDPESVAKGLLEGRYDAIFFSVCGEEHFVPRGYKMMQFCELSPCIVMARGHRLFDKPELTVEDFADESFVAMRGFYEPYWNYVKKACGDCGLPLERVHFVDNPSSMALELKRGRCVALMGRFYRPFDEADMRFFELSQYESSLGIAVVYSPENDNPFLKPFLREVLAYGKSIDR